MNCFSRGREVKSRCKSVPKSSVTKYISSKGEMKISLKLIILNVSWNISGGIHFHDGGV
jgi:hypothetical protein